MMPQSRDVCFGALRRGIVAIATTVLLWPGQLTHGAEPSIETANEVSGVRILEPGKWGSIRTVVANRSDIESNALVQVYFPSDPLRQFGSRIWLPPWSVRGVQTPVLLGSTPEQATAVELASRLQTPDGSTHSAASNVQTPIVRGRFETAMIVPDDDQDAIALVSAVRDAAGLKPTTFVLQTRHLPAFASGYEAIDSVFLGGPELNVDPIRREALIGYLERGGRLWIMLDSADQAWPRELLGDRWNIGVVDTVEVTKFTIEGPSGATQQELDKGVRLVRVIAPGFEVTHSVEGSPAALRRSIGRGELIVTTLASRGWLDSDGAPTSALGDLQAFVAPGDDARPISVADTRLFDEHIGREIGHRIIGRVAVAVALSFAVIAVAGAGMIAARYRRLEYVAPASVLCALASGAVLIGLGRASQARTASTGATDQLVLYTDLPHRAEVLSRSNVYVSPTDASVESTVRTTAGGTIVPDRTGSGTLEQFTWRDPESFELTGLDLRPGAVLGLTSHVFANPPGDARALIGVDESGIRGAIELGSGTWKDQPLLVTDSGVENLFVDENGIILPSPERVLGSAAIKSEEQIVRQRATRELLRRIWLSRKPMVLVWSDLIKTGVELPVPERGSSLRAIPVTYQPPEVGSEVAIPSVLMSREPVRGEIAGRKSGAVYDPLKREWLDDLHQPMLVVMRFRSPEEFGRMDVRSASLAFDLRAPGCRFDVLVVRDGQLRVVGGGSNPVGPTIVEVAGDDAPEMQSDRHILVGLEIHANEAAPDGPGWSLQRLDLSVRGVAQ